MALNKKQTFKELGSLLEQWRKEKYRSALEMFSKNKFSFSYYAYADYERGVRLPPIENLNELVCFFNKEPVEAILLWAKLQMPNDELKKIFLSSENFKKNTIHNIDEKNHVKSPSLDDTWSLNIKDRQILEKLPWLSDLCLRLAGEYPNEVNYINLGFKTTQSFEQFCIKYIQAWLTQGRIIKSSTGIRLALPHYYFPKSEDWHNSRMEFLQRGAKILTKNLSPMNVKNQTAYHALLTRSLKTSSIKKWIKRLEEIEIEFLGLPETKTPESVSENIQSLLVIFANRNLEIPETILSEFQ